MKDKVAYLERAIHSGSRVLDIVARYSLLGMMGVVVVNVILRLIWVPILGTYEFVGFLMVIVSGFALAYCAVQKGHVFVGFILDRFPQRAQLIVDIITGILAVTLFGIITWQCCVYAGMIWHTGQVSPTLHLAYHPIIYILAASCLMLCLVLVVDLINSLRKVKR